MPTVTGLEHESVVVVAAWPTVTDPKFTPEEVATVLSVSPS